MPPCTICGNPREPMMTKTRCVRCYKACLVQYRHAFISRHRDYMRLYRAAHAAQQAACEGPSACEARRS